MCCVHPGRELINATSVFGPASFEPALTSAFSRLDLPTLLRPRNATSGSASRGNCSTVAALIINRAGMRGEVHPLVRYFVFPAALYDLRRSQHTADRSHFDFTLQRKLQHFVHRC